MQQKTSVNPSLQKLKSVLSLGLTSNITTVTGCFAVWIVLVKNGWVSGFWETLLAVFVYVPAFMGDAVNYYVLGRIRLEYLNKWDDVRITSEGRALVFKHFSLLRTLSILPAYLYAALMLASHCNNPQLINILKIAFVAAFFVNLMRSYIFMKYHMAVRVPQFGGKYLVGRTLLAAGLFAAGFAFLHSQTVLPYTDNIVLACSLVYGMTCSIIHPLPTKYSLLRTGRPQAKKKFFAIEVLDDASFRKHAACADDIDAVTSALQTDGFHFISHIGMPLIELPLFQAWGSASMSVDSQTLALVMCSEAKKNVSRYLVSKTEAGYLITTDFDAPDAKMPETVSYNRLEKNTDNNALVKYHTERLNGSAADITKNPWLSLEELVKSVIRFLESDKLSAKSSAAALSHMK